MENDKTVKSKNRTEIEPSLVKRKWNLNIIIKIKGNVNKCP